MPQVMLSKLFKKHRKPTLIVAVTLAIVLLTLISASWAMASTIKQLKSGDFSRLQSLQKTSQTISRVTKQKIPLIESVKYCAQLTELQPEIIASKNTEYETLPFNLRKLSEVLENHDDDISKCLENSAKSKIIQHFLPREFKNTLSGLSNNYHDLRAILDNLAWQNQTWLVLFQNSDELRATGGFTGSYALVSFNQGQISELVFEDIYDADGQFEGYVAPPPGVEEFLSSNNGLRLPDANWHPDNVMSVQQQLDFFALGRKQNVSGVAVVNLPLAEQLLALTGSVDIPDYETTISQQNLHQALREERDDFFAGSTQKKHILSQVAKQTLFKLQQLPLADYPKLLVLLQGGVERKEVMFYSLDQDLAEIIDKYKASGKIDTRETDYFLGLVESNVGINKANRLVETSIDLNLQEKRTKVTINLDNQNPVSKKPKPGFKKPSKTPDGYVDYERVLVAPDWQVYDLGVNGQTVENWHEDLITTSTGQQLKQIGFLITAPEQGRGSASIEFSHPPLIAQSTLAIFKQPGQKAVPYAITFGEKQQHLLLESDQVIVLE